MKLYHGSTEIIQHPALEKGRKNNDYGKGFYCTENMELAKEWACQRNSNGYADEYELATDKLNILDLTKPGWSILHWFSILLENRTFSLIPVQQEAKTYLLKHYNIEYSLYDLIVGYRANDSYFTFASNFLNNEITLSQLEQAMTLGELGIQIVLKSQKAFDEIKFLKAHRAESDVYHKMFSNRDNLARQTYKTVREKLDVNGIYIIDILRGYETKGSRK